MGTKIKWDRTTGLPYRGQRNRFYWALSSDRRRMVRILKESHKTAQRKFHAYHREHSQ